MKRLFIFYTYIALILIILSCITVQSQNILTNGGFESCISVVVFKVYVPPSDTLATSSVTSVQDNYAFVTIPQSLNSSFISGDTIFMNLNWVSLPFLRFSNLFKQ